ncbi:MAG: MBL fold metallo-hydrolase [Pirellulaceae bacterium]|nr:MBL fold metallo-hydrolase [Pirellulaceae bacterium]
MRHTAAWVWALVVGLAAQFPGTAAEPAPSAKKTPALPPASADWPEVLVHQDTCNVFALREGDSAILFNLGDGGILERLPASGIKNVEWVLFTDHHREQCQGIDHLDRAVTKLAAPQEEQPLFEMPLNYRKWRPALSDPHTVHGASYVRPPAAAIKLDRLLADGEVFRWRGHEITCLATTGHSPGGMSFVLRKEGQSCAFIGGLMHDGARMTNWYDTEWDYGFGKGLDALIASTERLRKENLAWAFPAHGPVISDAGRQLADYHRRLVEFRPDYLRGYPVKNLTQRAKTDPHTKPTAIPQIVQVTPHLYKFSNELAGKNFAILIADSGRGLLLDCGIFPELLLHELVREMQTHLGLKSIDALWINHMHGDHFTLGAVLKKRYGTKIWTLDRIVDKVENPLRYDYCALITSYNPEFTGLAVDRPLKDGEIVEWEGLKLHIDWMPGQTEFGNCLWLDVDGKRVAFTGDNLFGDPSDPEQNGHEAVVARNSAILEEGYLLGSKYLRDLKPDIVMGAHNVLMANPAAFLDRYHEWAQRIIVRYRELLPDPNYEYQFDPFWVSAYPYRVDLQTERTQEVTITVRNFRDRPQRHHVRLKLPPGIAAEPAVLEGIVGPKSRARFTVRLSADPSHVPAGVQMIPLDITLDGERYGERFDFLVQGQGAE